MNYELAKQLKDAGFQQIWRDNGVYYLSDGSRVLFQQIKYATDDRGMVISYAERLTSIPSLSELIEACGEMFTNLEQRYDQSHAKYVWCAWAEHIYAHGSTSEEAVAKLWLALQKK